MKVGSIVECINGEFDCYVYKLIKTPVKGEVYTVREIVENVAVRLEEIVNPKLPSCDPNTGKDTGVMEAAFSLYRFRELFPPSPIEELIGDALTAPIPEQVKQLN